MKKCGKAWRNAVRISWIILGMVGVSVAIDAIQLASGGDFGATPQDQVINRIAKSDARASRGEIRQAGFRGLSDASTFDSVPVSGGQTGHNDQAARNVNKSMEPGKSMLACEAVVSILTEVARQLQPGRCIT